MREMILPLKRTVFLPKGSPGICSVREIKADVRHFEVAAEGGRVFCSGETDLLIEYLSFAPGKQYPGYEGYEQQLSGGGSMWQVLLTMPFELTGAGDLPCPPLAELACGEMNWFMVSPHALEMEIELCLSWQDEAEGAYAPADAGAVPEPAGWQQITLADVERESARRGGQRHNLNINGTKTKEECEKMEHDDKLMRLGVSDQGWQIVTHTQEQQQPPAQKVVPELPIPEPAEPEISILAAAVKEVAQQKAIAAEEAVVEEVAVEKTVVAEVVVEERILEEAVAETVTITETITETIVVEAAEETEVEEPLVMAVPLLNIQTVETPWQPPCEQKTQSIAPSAPMQMEHSATKSRAAGLPRLHVRHEQMRLSSYQVNFQIEDDPAQK